MRKFVPLLALCVMIGSGVAATAQAGWVIEWNNTAVRNNGTRMPTQTSTMEIEDNRVRVTQPHSISIIDYDEGTYTLMNPEKNVFWTGSVADWVEKTIHNRAKGIKRRIGETSSSPSFQPPPVDEDTLPLVTIEETREKERIAERDTTKYRIKSRGEVFQELWMATDIDVSGDLDPEKQVSVQRKMSGSYIGRKRDDFNALYRSDDYVALLRKGYPLRVNVHHGLATHERVATAVREADVDGDRFEVPEGYRRVRLNELFEPVSGSETP